MNAKTTAKSSKPKETPAGRWVSYRPEIKVVDCTIRDISDTGARLICGDQTAVPSQFQLITKADNLMRDVRVQWRRGGELGVLFTSEPRKAPLRKW